MPPQPKLTHFLALPLVTSLSRPQLQHSLTQFMQSVTNKSSAGNPNGIPPRAIRPVGTLHLTLGVMSLLDEARVEGALNVLHGLDLKSLFEEAEKGLKITLKGLTTMHAPSKTSVLYSAPVDDDDGSLQAFCERLRDVFIKEGFIIAEERSLLLHATILNTIYVPGVRGKGSGGHGKHKAKLTIDAREILEDYEEFVWMKDVSIEKVAIFKMGARKVEDGEGDEEYIVEGSVEMPR